MVAKLVKVDRQALSQAAGGLLDWLFPPVCAACGAALEAARDTICQVCWMDLGGNGAGPYCPACGKSSGPYELMGGRCHRCQDMSLRVDKVVRVGEYGGALKKLVLAFKFSRQERLDRFLGELLGAALLGRPDFEAVDYFVPVPLHWRRRWARGYNQSELLARALVRYLERQGRRAVLGDELVRLKNTVPQAQLPEGGRQTNLRGAFATRYGGGLAGRTVCLVDDVTTTGATLQAAARVLRKAGVARVVAAVLAVTAEPGRPPGEPVELAAGAGHLPGR